MNSATEDGCLYSISLNLIMVRIIICDRFSHFTGMSTTAASHRMQSPRQAAMSMPPISQTHQYNPLSIQNSFQQQISLSQNPFQSQTPSRITAPSQHMSLNNYIMQQHTPQPAPVTSSQTAQVVTSSSLTAAQGISQTFTALAAPRESPLTTHSPPAIGSTRSAEREFFDTLAAQECIKDNNKMADIKSSIREAETTLLTSNYFTKLAESESDIGLDDFLVDEDKFPAEKRQVCG